MQQKRISNHDDLIQAIRSILSKYRCSFSREEQVLLLDCIEKLEQREGSEDLLSNIELTVRIAAIALKVFSAAAHLKDMF